MTTVTINDSRVLEVWHLVGKPTKATSVATSELPAAEKSGLASQLRQAVVPIPSQIAEGRGRMYAADYIRSSGTRTEVARKPRPS